MASVAHSRVFQERLGHTTIAMDMLCGHASPAWHRAAANLHAAVVGSATRPMSDVARPVTPVFPMPGRVLSPA